MRSTGLPGKVPASVAVRIVSPRADHRKQAWVKSLYHVDIDDARLFSLVLDASLLPAELLLETLLGAGGAEPRSWRLSRPR